MNKTFLSILAGLGGMFGWGISDFLANTSSEKIGHERTFFWSQVAGVLLIGVILLFLQPSFSIPLWLLGVTFLAGISYAVGYLLFYKGFELGNVSVVSAVINLQVIFVILISFFLRGQTLTFIQVPAILLLLLGVTLVSVNLSDLTQGTVTLLKGVKETLASTIFFGVFYWPLSEYVVEKVDWLSISLIVKLTALGVVWLLSLLNRKSLAMRAQSSRLYLLIMATGVLEAAGSLSATFGQSYGDGIIVAPISSALTVVTVALAMIFTKEKITSVQGLGIVLVVAGIVMTAF